MKIKEWIKKHYLIDRERSLSDIVRTCFLYGFYTFISVTMYFLVLTKYSSNAINGICPKFPFVGYLWFSISFFLFLKWIDFMAYLYFKHKKLKNDNF